MDFLVYLSNNTTNEDKCEYLFLVYDSYLFKRFIIKQEFMQITNSDYL